MLDHTFDSRARCPACGELHDRATAVDHDCRPDAGSISVCVRCGGISVFNETLELELMKASEFAALPEELRLQLELLRRVIRESRP